MRRRRGEAFSVLSEREACVLDQLASGEKYGLELVAGSRGSLSRGGVYVLLTRMKEKGVVAEVREEATPAGESGPPRRFLAMTELGELLLRAHWIARSRKIEWSDEEHRRMDDLVCDQRVLNCLLRAGVVYVGELTCKTRRELLEVRGWGKKTLQEVEEVLEELGLRLSG